MSVQGLGNVGRHLCRLLHASGAKLLVTDIDKAQIAWARAEFGAAATDSEAIYAAKADIFAPCAIGAILNPITIPQLTVDIVAGGANNQLANPGDAESLHHRGILYAPDYVANGGGIINVASEILKITDTAPWVAQKLQALDATLDAILSKSKQQNTSPARVSDGTVQALMAKSAA